MGSNMSLSATLKKVAFAAPLVFAFAASNSNAAGKLPVIEPNATDLSKPLTAACVETTPGQPGLTAFDKLKIIMDARGQMIAASGDQIVAGPSRQEIMFTISNNFSGKEGYIIDSSASKADRVSAKSFCFRTAAKNAAFVDVSKEEKVPVLLNQGDLGIALSNNHNLGSKVAVMGIMSQGSLYAVHFNPTTHKGAYKESDAQGGGFRDLAVFENFDYSPKMKAVMQQLADAKAAERVAANTSGSAALALNR